MLVRKDRPAHRLTPRAARFLFLPLFPLLPFVLVQAHEALSASMQSAFIDIGAALHPFSLLTLGGYPFRQYISAIPAEARPDALAQAYLDWIGTIDMLALVIGVAILVVGLIVNRDRWGQVAMPPVLKLIGGCIALALMHLALRNLLDLRSPGAQAILAPLCLALLLLLLHVIDLAFKPPPQRFGRVHEYGYGTGGDGVGGGDGDGGGDGGD